MRFIFTSVLLFLVTQTSYAASNQPPVFFSDDTPTIVFNRIDKALEPHPAPYEWGQLRRTYLHVIDNSRISVYLVSPAALWINKKIRESFLSWIEKTTPASAKNVPDIPTEVFEAVSKSETKKPFTLAALNLKQNSAEAEKLKKLEENGAELIGHIIVHATSTGRTYVSWERSLKDDSWLFNSYDFLKKVVEQRQPVDFTIERGVLTDDAKPPSFGVGIKVPSFFGTSLELQKQRNQLDGTPIDEIHALKMNKLIERARRLGDNITTSLRERRDEYLKYDRSLPDVEIIEQLEKIAAWAPTYADALQRQIKNDFSKRYKANQYLLQKNIGIISQTYGYAGSDRMLTRSLALTEDGGSVVAGYSNLNGDQQPLLLKFNAKNQLLWQKLLPTISGSNQQFRAVVEGESGSLVLAMLLWKDDKTTSTVVKTDSLGERIWEQRFPGMVLNTIAVGSEGYYYAGGRTQADNRNAVLIKLDKNGSVIWQRKFGGTDDSDTVAAITPLKDALLVCGYGTPQGSSERVGYLAKISLSGKTIWESFPGTPGTIYFKAVALADGRIVAAGTTAGDIKRAAIISVDPSGKTLWEKMLFENSPDIESAAYDLAIRGGQLVTAGSAYKMAYIASFSPDGDNVQHQSIGKSSIKNDATDSFEAIQIRSNGSGLVAGETESYAPPGESNLWLISF